MDTFTKRVITVIISLFMISYVVYQCIQVLYDPIKTETVFTYSEYEKVDAKGIAVRNETLVSSETNGYLNYLIENGSRVSKGGTIAQVFSSEADCISQKQTEHLTEEITMLQEIQAQGKANRTNLDVIDKQIQQTVGQFATSVNSPSITDMDTWQSKLLAIMNKRQITIGKVNDFNERIEALTKQKEQVSASFSNATADVSSPVAGYFINTIDGFESSLTNDIITALTTDKLQELMNSAPELSSKGIVGKVVSDYKWYFACLVPSEYAGELREDATPDLILPFVSNKAIPATVVSTKWGKDGTVAVVFECSYMSSALSSIRRESVQIRLKRYEGLRVSSRSIITNEDGEQGVYALVGDTVDFRKVKILYAEPDYVICQETNEDGYLKLYDDIIVEGKGLYDGKIVR